jgi:hypothetical protein
MNIRSRISLQPQERGEMDGNYKGGQSAAF